MIEILDSLLAPLARLMVARGVAFSDFAERMKAHYVQAAREQVDGKATDSSLSVMTGLQRRDVARLRGFETKAPRPNHLARLVALWQTKPGYQRDGDPIDLEKNGPAPSFEELAREVRRDVHPRTSLDALILAETVSIVEETGKIRLEQQSYQPLKGSEEQIEYLARNVGDHLDAAGENVRGDGDPHFERAVHYSGLSDAQIERLKADYNSAQLALLRDLSQKAAAMKRDNSGVETARFRAGGYFYHRRGDTE